MQPKKILFHKKTQNNFFVAAHIKIILLLMPISIYTSLSHSTNFLCTYENLSINFLHLHKREQNSKLTLEL